MAGPDDELFNDLDQPADEPSAPEPEPEAPPAEEPPAASDPPAAAAPPPAEAGGHTVPLSVLLEERRERQELQARLAAIQTPPAAEAKPDAEPEPDFLEDPKAYIDRKNADIAANLQKIQEANQATAQQTQAQAQERALLGAIGQDEAAFVAKTADYYDAVAHQRTALLAIAQTQYPQATGPQLAEQVRVLELNLAYNALVANKSPAQVLYDTAKASGYRPAAAGTPPTAAAPAGQTLGNKVAEIDAARRASAAATLGAGGGGGTGVDIDGEADPVDLALQERFKRR